MADLIDRPWKKEVLDVLEQVGVRQIAYVPDAGHAYALRAAQADPDIRDIVLATEEEGIGVVADPWLGGKRALLPILKLGRRRRATHMKDVRRKSPSPTVPVFVRTVCTTDDVAGEGANGQPPQ